MGTKALREYVHVLVTALSVWKSGRDVSAPSLHS